MKSVEMGKSAFREAWDLWDKLYLEFVKVKEATTIALEEHSDDDYYAELGVPFEEDAGE